MPVKDALSELIDATPWIDTHEHLIEERHRLGEGPYGFRDWPDRVAVVPADWTALISDDAIDDLAIAAEQDGEGPLRPAKRERLGGAQFRAG